jgi:exosortase/archaeosortase family protein
LPRPQASDRPVAAEIDRQRPNAGLTRDQLFFWLFLLAAGNAIAGMAIHWTIGHGFWPSLVNLFGISAVVWLAGAAGLAIMRENDRPEPIRRGDWPIAIIVVGAALVPLGPASAGALTLLSLYGILTSPKDSQLRRAAIIFLTVTGVLLWGRMLLALLSRPLLTVDTFFVAKLFATEQRGNLLAFADRSGIMAVAPGCSSLQGMSIAIVLWALVNQWFKVPFGRSAVGWLLAALAATIAINVARIGSMVSFPQHLAELHTGLGWHLFSWTTLGVITAICLYGARREVFARS